MNRQNKEESSYTFFGLNFGLNLGCCGGDRDDLSVSSYHSRNMQPNPKYKSKKKDMVAEEAKVIGKSNANNDVSDYGDYTQDWTDDDLGLPQDQDMKGTSPFTIENGQTPEDVCPTEPFDPDSTFSSTYFLNQTSL